MGIIEQVTMIISYQQVITLMLNIRDIVTSHTTHISGIGIVWFIMNNLTYNNIFIKKKSIEEYLDYKDFIPTICY